ncbi:MAG: preprotein translocase subunit SecY [Bacilli bacterium]|nr:preprotein translocase subunit SecY [Acholeplasmataceae bacterium]MDY2902041.1 preprotein translocase subunit SecY [Bacilli bacterium]
MATSKTSSTAKKIIIMLLVTFGLLIVYRLGAFVTLPFINPDIIFKSTTDLNFGFLDVFSGGALSNFSILCLGISPYITASIVIQLLQMDIVPRFKELAEEGEEGRKKLNQYTRYIALGLAFVQSLTLVIGININYNGAYFLADLDFVSSYPALLYIYLAIVATAGTAFCLWLAELITAHGLGNGSSMLIVAGILATFPQMFSDLIKQLITTEATRNIWVFVAVVVILILIIVFIVFMEGAERKIPIQYANRPAAASFQGKSDSNIPIKLNSASVIPVIFASTLLSLPTTIISLTGMSTSKGTAGYWLMQIFSTTSSNTVDGVTNVSINAIGLAVYIILIVIFSFFYSFLQLNPEQMADNLQKQNAYVPGVRPGEETTGYISRVLFKITVLGATYLSIVAILPIVMTVIFNLPSSAQIGGTSLIIVVGVAIETWKQLKQTKQEKQYRGFIE